MTNTTPPSGPISLADVRQALADTDPSGTNAGALRKLMGRGSYGGLLVFSAISDGTKS